MPAAKALPSYGRDFSTIPASAPADQLDLGRSERQEAFRSTEGRTVLSMEDLCSTTRF